MRLFLSALFIIALIFLGAKMFGGEDQPFVESGNAPSQSVAADQTVDQAASTATPHDGILLPTWTLGFLVIGASISFLFFVLIVLTLMSILVEFRGEAHPISAGFVLLGALVLIGLANPGLMSGYSFSVSLLLGLGALLIGWLILGVGYCYGMWKYDHHRWRLRVDDGIHEFNRKAGRRGTNGLVLESIPMDQAYSFQDYFGGMFDFSRLRETPPHPDKDRARNISRIFYGPALIVPTVLREGLVLFVELGLKPLIGSMRRESEKSAKQRSDLVERDPVGEEEASS